MSALSGRNMTVSTVLIVVLCVSVCTHAAPIAGSDVKFTKIVLDTAFRAEGVAAADVNRDGLPDVIAGEVWYQAPDWKMHEIQTPGQYDPAKGYSATFSNYAYDVNGDGWVDSITTTMMGQPCRWFENPKGQPGHWKARVGADSACNETPLFADLFGNGKCVPLFGVRPAGDMAWFEFTKDPEAKWTMHRIAGPEAPGTQQFSHGLGVGDVNGDGRNDVLITEGWWEAPQDRRQTDWKFHPVKLGDACSDMLVYDIDEDGDSDIITSSAHNYGVWWFEQIPVPGADPTFKQHEICKDFSQTHALKLVDINGDGKKDFVAGKRYFAHMGKDPGANEPAYLYWFEIGKKDSSGKCPISRHLIDDDSGAGTQFDVTDFNKDGRPDIAISNKKGVFVFIQK
jgi:hypothetical protein